MYKLKDKTFKEINKKHDMICIEEVKGIRLAYMGEKRKGYYIIFFLATPEGCGFFESDLFDSEAEAIKFRNDIMGWKSENL